MKNVFNRSTIKSLICALVVLTFSLVHSLSYAQTHAAWLVPKPALSVQNPVPTSKTATEDAKSLYVTNCSPCHGNKGKGDGPAAQALNPKPADHTSAAIQGETDGSLYYKLTTGRSPMPSYKTILNDKQRWELVDYIRTLAKKR